MASSSSSSSSVLSPNAPPFIPPPASSFISQQPISYQPTAITLSAKATPFAKTPNSNSNLDNTHLIGSPYYPCYGSSLVGFDGLSSSHLDGDDVDDFTGIDLGPWNAPSDEVEENGIQSTWSFPSVDLQGIRPKVKITAPKTSVLSKVVISSKKPEPLLSKFTLKTCTTCNEKPCDNHCSTEETSSLNSLPEKLIPNQKDIHDWRVKENDTIAKKLGTDANSSLTKPLKLLRVNTSKVVKEKNDSLDTSAEACNENDLDLDSPCWKGIQAYKRSPFQMDDPKIMNHTEESEHLNSDEAKKYSRFVTNISSSSHSENEGKYKEQTTNVVQDQCRISDEKGEVLQKINVISDEKREVVQKINVELSSVKPQSDFPSVKSYEQLIDETLLCLRKSLVSRIYKDESELNELLRDVLFLADHYPEANILNNKKGTADENDDDLKKKSSNKCIQDSVEKNENTIPSGHMISTHDMDMHGAMQPIGHYTTHLQDITEGSHYNLMLGVDQPHILGIKYDAISKSDIPTSYKPDKISSDINIVKGMAHDFEAVLKRSFCEKEQNLQTLVHKNLWIEAQVKLFSLKYEHQLACAEIEILKRNQHPRERFQEVSMLPGLKSLGSSQASDPFIDAGSSSARDFHPRSGSENYISFQRLLA